MQVLRPDVAPESDPDVEPPSSELAPPSAFGSDVHAEVVTPDGCAAEPPEQPGPAVFDAHTPTTLDAEWRDASVAMISYQ